MFVKCLTVMSLASGILLGAPAADALSPCQEENPPPGCPHGPQKKITHHTQNEFIGLKWAIYSIVYAPPGSSSGSGSSVGYSSTSTVGTKLNVTDNFTNGVSVEASVSAGAAGTGVKLGGAYSASTDSENNSTLELKSTDGVELALQAVTKDGLDHDQDVIYIWINPGVALIKSWDKSSLPDSDPVVVPGSTKYQWTVGTPTGGLNLMKVTAGELRNPSTLPANVAAQLQAYGIGPDVYPEILSFDPLAAGADIRQNPRYAFTGDYFPYETPAASGQPDSPTAKRITSDNSYTAGTVDTNETDVSAYVDVTFSSGIASGELKVGGEWKWSHKSSHDKTDGYSSSADLLVGDPSTSWTGVAQTTVYWDTIFHTFAFALYAPQGQPLVAGNLQDTLHHPLQSIPVSIKVGGVTRRTVTDRSGTYRFYELPPGPTGELIIGGKKKTVQIGSTTSLDMSMTLPAGH